MCLDLYLNLFGNIYVSLPSGLIYWIIAKNSCVCLTQHT